jgi:hypothetical protein
MLRYDVGGRERWAQFLADYDAPHMKTAAGAMKTAAGAMKTAAGAMKTAAGAMKTAAGTSKTAAGTMKPGGVEHAPRPGERIH